MVNEFKYGNCVVPAILFQYGCHILCTFIHYLKTSARNNATCVFFTLHSYLISVSSNDIALVQMRLVNLLAYQLY